MVHKFNLERPLEEREESVLGALVYEFINTGKPVGSRSFVQKYSFSISPATMRNIMVDLENMGFLMQPHTSAGRIPTDLGYRFYVNSLLDNYDFSHRDNVQVNEDLLNNELLLDKLFLSVIKMLSFMSKYAGIILTPRSDFAVVKRIELILLDNNDVLMILVARTGIVMTKKVSVSSNLTQDELYEYSRYLSTELSGYSLNEIREGIFDKLRAEKSIKMGKDIALDIAELALSETREAELSIEGIENLLKIPEMVQEERLSSLLNIIEEKNILKKIMEKIVENDGVKILIGQEINETKVSGCSMVATSYKISNKKVGAVGVLGPTRMDYEKVVPLVDYSGKIISDYLTKMSM
ncbi:MAG TPA: heat-inducible transcriptional repressor HrcA [Spirochaetota bacterium]|nr:heat-inducible transcriptional repressor HrcA [Spirochaetota bacterium]HPI88177.1 heat-inducible transcriptional repressor HrcA [Spirochaetota bacterium]HPR47952.1 heat-inducible transcriptional repressor HrcA [Spirochaetota bacterium]